MQIYFIHDGHKQLGPFSAIELIKRKITATTPVFTPMLNCYVPAADIPELQDIFKGNIILERSKESSPNLKKWSIVGAAIILIISFIVIFKLRQEIQDTSNASSAPNAITQQVMAGERESFDPSKYLHVRGKMHNNLLGKKIIKGKISNLASFTGYKDLQVAVTFLSGTQKELQTQRFFINDVVNPNNDISFRDVFNAPDETEHFRIKIVSAVPAQ